MSTEQTAPSPMLLLKRNRLKNPLSLDLLTCNISDENTALNVMVGFLNLAQRKGALALMNLQDLGMHQ